MRASAATVSPPAAPRRRAVRALAAIGGAVLLVATFALYLRPGLSLDLGQLMAFCGFR